MLRTALACVAVCAPVHAAQSAACTGTLYPWQELHVGEVAGVHPADFDGDGHEDLLIARWGDEPISLYPGHGDGTFAAPIEILLGVSSSRLQAGDVTNDGQADLVVDADAGLHVFVSAGDGSFDLVDQPPLGAGDARTIALLDVNDDGVVDVVTHDYHASEVVLVTGTGTGHFEPFGTIELGAVPDELLIAHLNGDAHVDFALFDESFQPGKILLNDGAGHLLEAASIPVAGEPRGLVTGDFDGDGNADVAFGYKNREDVTTYWGDGDAGFREAVTGVRMPVRQTLAADLDGDGLDDLALLQEGYDRLRILRGRPDAAFGVEAPIDLHTNITLGVAADLDHDQDLELILEDTEGLVVEGRIGILPGHTAGFFAPETAIGAGGETLLLEDLDGDGELDVVLAGSHPDSVTIARGVGDGTFGDPYEVVAGVNAPERTELADFDQDGLADLLVVPKSQNKLAIHFASAPGEYTAPTVFDAPDFNDATAGDLDADGVPDLATVGGNSSAHVALGNGDGTFGDWQEESVGHWPLNVELADLDADGHLDLLATNFLFDGFTALFGNGDGTFELGYSVDVFISSVNARGELTVADLNADGALDVAIAARMIHVLMGVGDGTLEPPVTYAAEGSRSVTASDLNGDGILDLLGGEGAVLLGNGDGTFEERAYGGLEDGQWAAAGDLDHDGSVDLVLCSYVRTALYRSLCGGL